jgi:hypothetical protein
MALSLVGANLVWQQARIQLAASKNVTAGIVLRELKKYLSTYKGNPKLQLVVVDGTVNSSDGGNTVSQILANAACTLYAVVLTKIGSVETVFKASNSASTAATDGTQDLAIAATAAGDVVEIYPDGRAYASGLTVTEDTTRTGSTLTLKANRLDGFVIIGQ